MTTNQTVKIEGFSPSIFFIEKKLRNFFKTVVKLYKGVYNLNIVK